LAIDKIRVMISSRSNTTVFNPPVNLKKLRRSLKDFIVQKLKISEEPLFEVWICEDDTGDGIDSWWETSKEEVRKADLVLVLYTEEAGSKVQDIGLGICHAELFEAVKYSREKVLTILTLGDATVPSKLEDRSFQEYGKCRMPEQAPLTRGWTAADTSQPAGRVRENHSGWKRGSQWKLGVKP